MMNITDLEAELLLEIAHSDFSSDGHGFNMCYRASMGYPNEWAKVMRGCMSSLRQKGVISVTTDNYDYGGEASTWISVRKQFLCEATPFEREVKGSIAEWSNYSYRGLNRVICPKIKELQAKVIYGQPLISNENKESETNE